jgi:sterol desaturase/sphingolipid hydroxylase (fatty acid hydroxylase superfamily)
MGWGRDAIAVEETVYLPVVIIAVFGLLFGLERLFPLRPRTRALWDRLLVNGCVTALAFVTAALVVRPAINMGLERNAERPFGLIHLVDMPAWLRAVLAFGLMDLAFYYWHLANHKVPLLWRFHNVHHIDPDLDVSTGFRFHFAEVALSAVFRVVQVTAIGLSVWMFLIYEVAFQANTLFHHSNVRLPIGLERALNRLLVTPRMHAIHHSQVKGETNSNYGVVLPWWDWLHRTLGLNVPQAEIRIGVAGYSQPEDNLLWKVLTMPFRRQRDYWRTPDGETPTRDADVLGAKRTRLER